MVKDFYSVKEFAQLIRLSTDRVYEYLRTDRLHGARIGPHSAWRIPASEIERLKSSGSFDRKEETQPFPHGSANIPLVATRFKFSLSQITPKDWAIWGLHDTGEPPLTSEAGIKIWMDRGQPVVTLIVENDNNFTALISYLKDSFPEFKGYDSWRQSLAEIIKACWTMAREIMITTEKETGLPFSPLPVMGKGHLVDLPRYIYEFALDNYLSQEYPELEILPNNTGRFQLTVQGSPDYELAVGSLEEIERCRKVTIDLANQYAQDERFGQIRVACEDLTRKAAPFQAILTDITEGKSPTEG